VNCEIRFKTLVGCIDDQKRTAQGVSKEIMQWNLSPAIAVITEDH